ncbi:outer membrane protein assembly factor BamB family protein [Yinghuangia sp. YIM S10712]|uniref:outer membrane protein assembly factor BamB family protein n=1 Tax=Yinghuangia sp. YIM S10712 TaxID=3436930 RepID=UPI003F531615
MTNPPPPFQVPDGNEPDDNQQQPYVPPQGQYGPPQGDPQAFTPPYGIPAAHNPQQPPPPQGPQQQSWAPPPQDQQQWQPPQQDQQWQSPQQSPQQPPQQSRQWAPPPAQQFQPPPPQQFQPSPPQQGGQQPPFAPPQQAAPQPPYAPPQPTPPQPQWSGGGGPVASPAAGEGVGAAAFTPAGMPPPMGAPTGFDSGPGGGMPVGGPPRSHDSGPGSGGGGFPPASAPPPSSYGPPSRPQALQLGPPRAPRPHKHKRSVLLPTAVGALLIAAVAIPGAVKQAERDPSGSSAGEPLAKAEVLWSIREGRDGPETPPTKVGEEKLNRAGVWYTDTTVVIAEAKRLAAYNLDTGALAWEYSSSDGEWVCDVDLQGGSKEAFVAFGGEKDCSTLEAVDIVAGKKIWSTPTKEDKADSGVPDLGDLGFNMSTGIAVSGGVAVFNEVGYRVSDGRKLWSAAETLGEDCSTLGGGGYSGGAKLVVVASCGGGLGSGSTVTELDPVSGAPKWKYEVPGGTSFGGGTVAVVSTDPVVVMKSELSLNLKNPPPPEIIVLDDQGRESFKINDLHAVVAPRGSSEALTGTVPILATDKVIYIPSTDLSDSFGGLMGGANQLSAYDRATGQKLWTQSVATGSKLFTIKSQGQIYPIRVEESGDLLVLVQDGGTTKLRPMSLIRVSARDGSMTNLKEFPKRVTVAKGLMYSVLVHERDGRVFLAAQPKGPDPAMENLPFENPLGQAVHYDMSSYRLIVMQ